MDGESSEYTGTPDPNRMPDTPDVNDERPGSAISNQQADSGKKPFCSLDIAGYTALLDGIAILITLDNKVPYTALYSFHH